MTADQDDAPTVGSVRRPRRTTPESTADLDLGPTEPPPSSDRPRRRRTEQESTAGLSDVPPPPSWAAPAAPAVAATPPASGERSKAAEAVEAVAFRPRLRPPTAVLIVLDDGRTTGEMVRLRRASTIIGRVEGDIVIPHDDSMSSRHVEILREHQNGRWIWTVKDLGSTNGTFLRAPKRRVAVGDFVLIAGIRFEARDPAATRAGGTVQWDRRPAPSEPAPTAGPPGLKFVRLDPLDADESFTVVRPGSLGRNPAADYVVDDSVVDPLHARFVVDSAGSWILEDADSKNGVWFKVPTVSTEKGLDFQLGEQRFQLRVLT
ncbi:MAG: FHA domain-containing protein [Planctomycetia bacterium]